MRKRNKAISTVVGSLLIMVIVILLGTALYAWTVMGYGSYQNQVGTFLSSKSDAAKERILVEQAWFTDANSDTLYEGVRLYIRNTGEISISVVDVSIDGSVVSSTSPTLPLDLGLDQVKVLNMTLTSGISKGAIKLVTVTTERGHTVEGYWQVG